LIACDDKGVTFKWKDYRIEAPERYKVMTPHRRVHPPFPDARVARFHRIRYYGLLASGKRAENVARARELLAPPLIPIDAIKAIGSAASKPQTAEPKPAKHQCPCCGGHMIVIERFDRGFSPNTSPRQLRRRSGSTRHEAASTLRSSNTAIAFDFSGRAAGSPKLVLIQPIAAGAAQITLASVGPRAHIDPIRASGTCFDFSQLAAPAWCQSAPDE
jgi:hypothetical protein